MIIDVSNYYRVLEVNHWAVAYQGGKGFRINQAALSVIKGNVDLYVEQPQQETNQIIKVPLGFAQFFDILSACPEKTPGLLELTCLLTHESLIRFLGNGEKGLKQAAIAAGSFLKSLEGTNYEMRPSDRNALESIANLNKKPALADVNKITLGVSGNCHFSNLASPGLNSDCYYHFGINPQGKPFIDFFVDSEHAYKPVWNTARAQITAGDRKSAAEYYHHGIIAGLAGNTDAAIACYTTAIQLNSVDARAFYSRGMADLIQGNLDAAISDLTQAIKLSPKYVEAYLGRATVYRRQENLDAAIHDLTRAIELNPRCDEAYEYRGRAHELKGENAAAKADFDKASELRNHGAL